MRTGGVRPCSHVRGESCHRLRKRVLNRRILAWSGTRTTAVFARGVLCTFWPQKSTDRSLRLVLFAAFWSAVNRGLRPRGTLYFLTAKSTKNTPADACAYFVPSNVRNGRLFAGLQANRPRFLPLLAGPSFHGSGIGPGSFAAIPSFRPGKEANTRTCEQGRTSLVRLFAENPGIAPGSGFKPPHSRLQRRKNNDSPRARSGRLHSLVLAAPAQRGPEVVPAKATCGWFWRF